MKLAPSRKSLRGGLAVFELIACNLAMLSIAMIYYAWRDGLRKPPVTINERVAYMLWVAAQKSS